MSLHIALSVGGKPIEVLRVTNVGPTSDGEAHSGGERRYVWALESTSAETGEARDDKRRGGEVLHRREHGASVLAARVLLALTEARRMDP